jgi:subtilisin family serine protease
MRRRHQAIALTALASLLTFASLVRADDKAVRPFAPTQDGFVASSAGVLPYAPDRLLVQLTPAALHASRLEGLTDKTMAAADIGLATLDRLAATANVRAIKRAYDTRRDPARSTAAGVERWFQMNFETTRDMADLAREFAADPAVASVSVDWRAFPAAVPADPLYPNHWGHNNTAQLPGLDWGGTYRHTLATRVGTVGLDANAQAAWDGSQGYGASNVIVAIIDSGVDLDHPDLTCVTGYDFGDNDPNPDDDSGAAGHGTCCAGVAAATNNNLGCAGIAAGCRIMPLKVANSAGAMYFSAIQNALYYAADHGADVISLSLGAAITSDPATDAAITYAYNAGCTILAATGNENRSVISYPAIHAKIIGVGAASPCGGRKRSSSLASEVNPGVSTDRRSYTCDGERWWGSNYGVTTKDAGGAVDVLAPTILPTTDILGGGGYQPGDYEPYFNGTSCATPYAAGICALIISRNPTWTPAQIRTRLCSSAQDVVNVEAAAGWDRYSGYGLVDAVAAVAPGDPGPTVPVAQFAATPTGGLVPVTVTFADQTTGRPTSWVWNFGDGGTATAQNPSHTYAAPGAYTVTLTARNALGVDGETKTAYVTASAAPNTWTVITSSNFETGLDQYADGGADMARYNGTAYAHLGRGALNIQDNSGAASSFYHTAGQNVATYSDLRVSFWFKAVSMEPGEDFWVQYFDGTAWRTVATYAAGADFANDAFVNKVVSIPRASYVYPANAKLRFLCDAGDNNDDVYIDEILFEGYTGGAKALEAGVAYEPVPIVLDLAQNCPNPFNPRTTIAYTLPTAGLVSLRIFDIRGHLVRTLVDGQMLAGRHEVVWQAEDDRGNRVASGMYLYRLRTADDVRTQRMCLLK